MYQRKNFAESGLFIFSTSSFCCSFLDPVGSVFGKVLRPHFGKAWESCLIPFGMGWAQTFRRVEPGDS